LSLDKHVCSPFSTSKPSPLIAICMQNSLCMQMAKCHFIGLGLDQSWPSPWWLDRVQPKPKIFYKGYNETGSGTGKFTQHIELLGSGPFMFSDTRNVFTASGCDTYAQVTNKDRYHGFTNSLFE
jgi:hypothetical protein